jgi:hypothetical protein
VLITALISIAERVGANRIVRAEGRFHHPLGELSMEPESERAWRLAVLGAAVRMLAVPVDRPTVKTAAELAAG